MEGADSAEFGREDHTTGSVGPGQYRVEGGEGFLESPIHELAAPEPHLGLGLVEDTGRGFGRSTVRGLDPAQRQLVHAEGVDGRAIEGHERGTEIGDLGVFQVDDPLAEVGLTLVVAEPEPGLGGHDGDGGP